MLSLLLLLLLLVVDDAAVGKTNLISFNILSRHLARSTINFFRCHRLLLTWLLLVCVYVVNETIGDIYHLHTEGKQGCSHRVGASCVNGTARRSDDEKEGMGKGQTKKGDSFWSCMPATGEFSISCWATPPRVEGGGMATLFLYSLK